jgi:hypothetical protein
MSDRSEHVGGANGEHLPRRNHALGQRGGELNMAKPAKLPDDGSIYHGKASVPRSIPKGRVLAHNHIAHTTSTPAWVRGFRCLTWPKDQVPPNFKPCKCAWSGLPHVALPGQRSFTREELRRLLRQQR